MTTKQPSPHPIFSITWAFWYVCLTWAFFQPSPWPGLSVLLYFIVPEVLALLTNWRWTLSASWTWVVRKMSHHTRPFEGWNWLLVPGAAAPSAVMLRVGWLLDGLPGLCYAAIFALPSMILCHQHWLRPDVQG